MALKCAGLHQKQEFSIGYICTQKHLSIKVKWSVFSEILVFSFLKWLWCTSSKLLSNWLGLWTTASPPAVFSHEQTRILYISLLLVSQYPTEVESTINRLLSLPFFLITRVNVEICTLGFNEGICKIIMVLCPLLQIINLGLDYFWFLLKEISRCCDFCYTPHSAGSNRNGVKSWEWRFYPHKS